MADDFDNSSMSQIHLFTTAGEEDGSPTLTREQFNASLECQELLKVYESVVARSRQSWTSHQTLRKKLGTGGQGVVFLTERRGADGFTLPVALKIFSPERYRSIEAYEEDMPRQAEVASRVARVQHENLLVVENFLDRDSIRMMVMEWVEGFDLRRLLTPKMLGVIKERFSEKRWKHINETLVTAGPEHPRLKTGVAITVVSECLAALGAMHRNGLVHSDVKPANIMLKSSGHSKLIDFGTAFHIDEPPPRRACTPAYAAPEVLAGNANTPQSDLASLGYVVIELLSGRTLSNQSDDLNTLIEGKRNLADRLEDILPEDVARNDVLMSFCRGLIAADPEFRFESAEAASLESEGASAILRQLIKTDMSMEYTHDIRLWIEELLELTPVDEAEPNN